MDRTDDGKLEQAALWNGAGGLGWLEVQAITDRLFAPLEEVLVEALVGAGATRVLDVGCGAGGTTLTIARHLVPHGATTGIDISEPLIAAASARAAAVAADVRFIRGDAQRHRFAPGAFDAIASRFGVMFFDDPAAAFTNLHGATSPDGVLRCISWRGALENPFMTVAERAAASFVAIPPREPDGPGQFGLADRGRIRELLEASGWKDISVEALDVDCAMPREDLVPYLTHLGPLGRVLATLDAPSRARVVDAVRPAFDPYVEGDTVRFTAACWLMAAHR